MSNKQPLAFMSYVRSDDEHDDGNLTEFCKRLRGEVEIQTAIDFPIFQDKEDIKWGQAWKERIENSIDDTTFLIPIITPRFFKSEACRDELNRFIEREKKLKRNDLILPVYYVNCSLLDGEEECGGDELAQIIAGRQWTDWREFRFYKFTSPEMKQTLVKLANQIQDAMGRNETQKKVKKSSSKKSMNEKTAQGSDSESATKEKRTPSDKTEPPIHGVDPMHRADFATITEAIKAANPGDRILVRPGLYQEGIVMEKPLEIIGDGELSEIIVETEGRTALAFRTTMGRVSNITLRQNGGDFYCVDIAQGRLEMEGCNITSPGFSCVGIHGGADPHIRRNMIHDGKKHGIMVHDKGKGTIEENDIYGNGSSGVAIKEEGNPLVRKNRIHDGKENGVFVFENGKGTVEENEIFGNGYSGVEISEGGNPTIRQNRINKNGYEAIWIHEKGGGIFEDNDLRDNSRGAWDIDDESEPNVKRARNQK